MAEQEENEEGFFVIQQTDESFIPLRRRERSQERLKVLKLLPLLKEGTHFDIPIKSSNKAKEVRKWRSAIIDIRRNESPVYDKVKTNTISDAENNVIALRVFIPKYK